MIYITGFLKVLLEDWQRNSEFIHESINFCIRRNRFFKKTDSKKTIKKSYGKKSQEPYPKKTFSIGEMMYLLKLKC